MPTVVILEDDAAAREALAETLRRLFPRARVIASGVDARCDVVAGVAAPIILADLVVLERVRRRAPANARVVALTREMGPDTLLRAEALGVDASLRAPASAGQLQAVLEPMLDRLDARDPG